MSANSITITSLYCIVLTTEMYPHKPLSQRIVRAKSTPHTYVYTASAGSRIRCSYRQWASKNMEGALLAVENGASVRRAAEIYGVPKSSLHDRLAGKVELHATSGPRPYLSVAEEEELVSFLLQMARIGYPYTRKQVLALVQEIINSKGIDTTITNGWWDRFCNRHPKVTFRAAIPLSMARAMASDSEVLDRYYDMLEECLHKNEIFNKPSSIYNCDETGMALNPKCPKVVGEKGSKTTSCLTGGDKSQLTVLACSSAAGYAIPPYIVFDRKSLNPKVHDGEVPGTLYGLSKNGWINRELFHHWFHQHFLEYVPPTRPLILLLDGHSSHYCPDTIRLAAENQIIMFALPPHTTHITQPLDRGCFAPLKVAWGEACRDFFAKHPGRIVTRLDFCKVFSKAWYKAMSMPNIIASFKVTGICPFDRSVTKAKQSVSASTFKPETFKPEELAQRTGLAYIPLYSPSACTESMPRKRAFEHTGRSQLKSDCLQQTPISYSEPNIYEKSLLEMSSADSSFESSFYGSTAVPLRRATSISSFLIPKIAPSKLPTKHGKSSGLVLTSLENLKNIEERERKKEEEAQRKEARKIEREKKKKMKLEAQKRKSAKPSMSFSREHVISRE